MRSDLIIINEYCRSYDIEPSFLISLHETGLITIEIMDGVECIHISEISKIERFTRLHYDLSINMEGIDVINNLLQKIDLLQDEVTLLRSQLNLYDDNDYIDEL